MMWRYWQSVKIIVLLLGLAILSQSCTTPPEYQITENGNLWKLKSFGAQESKLDSAGVIYIDGVILDKWRKDTLQIISNNAYSIAHDDLSKVISNHFVGDKIEYISVSEDFLRATFPKKDTLIYDLYFDRMRTTQQLNDLKFKELSALDFIVRTDSVIREYTEYQGIYYKPLSKGDTISVLRGREIVLEYRGVTLSGKVFDDSGRMEGPLKFVMGNENQVIRGIELALENMHRKEKMRVIIPSWLAFGARGSAGGHVPPYATVVYDLEVVDVGK